MIKLKCDLIKSKKYVSIVILLKLLIVISIVVECHSTHLNPGIPQQDLSLLTVPGTQALMKPLHLTILV